MKKYLHLIIHLGGEFINIDLIVYEGGKARDLQIDVDKWSFLS